MEKLIELQDIKKYFVVPNGLLHAVDGINLSIEKGETLGIVGESGCGKSTLGRVMLRLHEPTSGHILYDGMDITTFRKDEMVRMRRYMQIIFQDPYASLNPRFTVAQIIREPLRLHKLCASPAEETERVEALMEMVGLSKRAYNAYPHEFDGGRRQRIVIARALAINPQFIVCDEPVSALDVSVQAQIINLMMELQEKLGLTYLFISHDLSVVKYISNNIGVMYLGQMIEKASKRAIFQRPLHPYTIALLSAIPSLDVERKKKKIILKGEITSPINPPAGCRFAMRCAFAQEECFAQDPELCEAEPGHYVACHRHREIMSGNLTYPS